MQLAMLGLAVAVGAALLAAGIFGHQLIRSIERAGKAAISLGQGRKPEPQRSRIAEVSQLQRSLADAGTLLDAERQSRLAAEAERERLLRNETAAREAAQAQNEAKDQFLAMLGHELRNPLAAISGAVTLLERGDADTARNGALPGNRAPAEPAPRAHRGRPARRQPADGGQDHARKNPAEHGRFGDALRGIAARIRARPGLPDRRAVGTGVGRRRSGAHRADPQQPDHQRAEVFAAGRTDRRRGASRQRARGGDGARRRRRYRRRPAGPGVRAFRPGAAAEQPGAERPGHRAGAGAATGRPAWWPGARRERWAGARRRLQLLVAGRCSAGSAGCSGRRAAPQPAGGWSTSRTTTTPG